MKRKTMKRLAAAMMTCALLATMFGMSVFAAGVVTDGEGITTVDISKTVTTDGDTYKPNTQFTFSVKEAGSGTYDNNVVYEGVNGGLTATGAAVSTPSKNDVLDESYSISGGQLTVNADVFTKPGVYHYQVSEEAGNYEGINYDSSIYDVYLYVYNSEEGYYVGNVVSVKNGVKADLAFTNDYGKNNDSTHDVTVTKEVTGNQADMNKAFDFNVSVQGAVGEIYKVVVKTTADATEQVYAITSGENSVTYSIKNGGSIQIYGLSENDTYTINENDYSGDGYTTTNQNNTGKVAADDTLITVTNTKNTDTPTGIIMTYAPYILMIAVAAVAIVLFLRRRNRAEF